MEHTYAGRHGLDAPTPVWLMPAGGRGCCELVRAVQRRVFRDHASTESVHLPLTTGRTDHSGIATTQSNPMSHDQLITILEATILALELARFALQQWRP